jgi:hypothetical protein
MRFVLCFSGRMGGWLVWTKISRSVMQMKGTWVFSFALWFLMGKQQEDTVYVTQRIYGVP